MPQDRIIKEAMAQLHITEAELARDITALLDRVQSGSEIVIERNAQPVAVLPRHPGGVGCRKSRHPFRRIPPPLSMRTSRLMLTRLLIATANRYFLRTRISLSENPAGLNHSHCGRAHRNESPSGR